MKIKITKIPSNRKDLGGILQASGSNWTPGNVSLINAGGTHSQNPYEGVQVGVDSENVPNLVEEGEVIFNDYVFSNRIKVPKEVCKALRVGQKKDGFTFAEVAKKLLAESKERPNDPISKKGLDANMQKLENYQEEVKEKMDAERAVEEFNSLPPEQQVAIMQQEGSKAQDAVAQEQMAEEFNNLPPEQQQAIAQQMAMEQQGVQQGPSPEEQAMMQQQYAQQSGINPQEVINQTIAMQQAGLNQQACGGRLHAEGGELGSGETQATDNEMAKYSDEELQDMIDDYQEAANGETKVTKGRLARLKRKAEKAEKELKRRYSKEEDKSEIEGEASEAPAEAMPVQQQEQQIMEEQSQQVNPEAMAMQQQMPQQMSPEQMAAAELQQQEGQQYAYGGNLYYDGGGVLGKYTPYFQNIGIEELLGKIYDYLPKEEKVKLSRKQFIDNNRNLYGTDAWTPYESQLEQVLYGINPEAKNSNLKFSNADVALESRLKYLPLNFGDSQAQISKNGANRPLSNKDFIDDAAYKLLSADNQAKDGNELGKILENIQQYQDATNALIGLVDTNDEYIRNWLGDMASKNSVAANRLVESDGNNGWRYKKGVTAQAVKDAIKKNRTDGKLGLFHRTPDLSGMTWKNRYWIKNSDGTYSQNPVKPDNAYSAINTDPYKIIDEESNQNFQDYYYQLKSEAEKTEDSDNKDTEYMTVGYEPKTNWTDYTLGMLPGLTGLAFQIGQGKPDTSGLDAAEAYAERYSGIMAPPHLTHGYIQPAIIDPRVRENTMNARRLGTNRILRNTGPSPSQAANILISDANYMNQMGLQGMQDWLANRQQEQQAAAFNRETNTTNANILNATDQFNAQMQANAAKSIADMKYKVALDKINQDNAYKAGILGNIGSIFTGLNEARKQQNINNQRDILLASGVFGETNPFLENYYGISKVDPATGKVVRGYKTGWYYRTNPKTGKPEYSEKPFLATPGITNACGGKLKKSKRKGYTY